MNTQLTNNKLQIKYHMGQLKLTTCHWEVSINSNNQMYLHGTFLAKIVFINYITTHHF